MENDLVDSYLVKNGSLSKSKTAQSNFRIVTELQSKFASRLNSVSQTLGYSAPASTVFRSEHWLRDSGQHGGGTQLVGDCSELFNRASINVSHVHYDDVPEKPLGSANALSTIIHPNNPHAPSVHIHISWTEMKSGKGYWRIMADLNPSVVTALTQELRGKFESTLKDTAPSRYEEAKAQGDQYFKIPALNRHRGISHYYLEAFDTGDQAADARFAQNFGDKVTQCYADILALSLKKNIPVTEAHRSEQIAYHTLYLFQVLTLDRGTTSGLLVHNQNDVGIMGSIPAFVDRDLLLSWRDLVSPVQKKLVEQLAEVLSKKTPSPVNVEEKRALAQVVRAFYQAHPEALDLQARGTIVPPTVQNHGR